MFCVKCSSENTEKRKYCGECGALIVTICSQCGFTNLLTDKFCGGCGLDFKDKKLSGRMDAGQSESSLKPHTKYSSSDIGELTGDKAESKHNKPVIKERRSNKEVSQDLLDEIFDSNDKD